MFILVTVYRHLEMIEYFKLQLRLIASSLLNIAFMGLFYNNFQTSIIRVVTSNLLHFTIYYINYWL